MPPQQNRNGEEGNDIAPRRMYTECDSMSGDDSSSRMSAKEYRVRKSSLIGMINWTHVAATYLPFMFQLGMGVLLALIIHQVVMDNIHVIDIHKNVSPSSLFNDVQLVLSAVRDLFVHSMNWVVRGFHVNEGEEAIFSSKVKITFLILCVIVWILKNEDPVFLLSYATFKAPSSWKVSHEQLIEIMRRQECFQTESLNFLSKLLSRSGTGPSTAWPPGIVQCLEGKPADRSIEASREEAKTIIFDIVERALQKAKTHPKEIDVLVINCSLFSPTPSLCAMVISKFGMRQDILSYSLSGMGCGASLISVDLARGMLQRHKGFLGGGKALVVSTEIITPNLYHGNDRSFLVQNTLFRCGGAAMVLSSRWADSRKALYKLLHIVRVQGSDENSYGCVYETIDKEGCQGVRLSKDIVKVAGRCMERNLTMLGPYVLPLTEQCKVVYAIVIRSMMKFMKHVLAVHFEKEHWAKRIPIIRPYVPDFKRGIDHFCIHAGGRAVIDGVEKNMSLETFHTEPSRMTLYHYGNTSSSSIWYELEYIQTMQQSNPLKKGDRILQIAFGSGFKCTSGVWLKL